MVGLAAWIAGTGIAVSVAWLGANVVITNAGVGPGIPVISVAVPAPSAAFAPAATSPATIASTPSGRATSARNAAASAAAHSPAKAALSPAKAGPSPSASATATAGDVHAYTLAGGNVTLDMTGGSVQLVTAVPNAGYSVQTWSGTGWLRVDFSSGPQVSSLIASWYQHAPTVTITN
jgi:hypothetical protein